MLTHTALVVDDEEAIRRLAVRLLHRAGFARVDEAPDGIEALDLLKTNRYCLALVDLRMPRFSGYDLLSLLEKEPLPHRPDIIVATAEDLAIARGRWDFNPQIVAAIMSKPFDAETLAAIGEGCIASRQREAAKSNGATAHTADAAADGH